jgi:hypothetical protein
MVAHWHRQTPEFIHEVSYEALVREPESEMHRVLAFCALSWHPACMVSEREGGTIRTASAAQARSPIHADSIGRWRPYANSLRPLQQELQRQM